MPKRRYLDKAAPADATYNSIRPVYRNIQVKKKDTPQRRENEAAKARARAEQARVTPANPRQDSIGPYREKTALDKAGGRLYAAAEQRAKEAQDREAAGVVLNALFKPIMPSTYIDIYDAYKRGEVNNVTDALAAPYITGSWSQRNPGKALAMDLAIPVGAGAGTKAVKYGTRGVRLSRAMNRSLGVVPDNFVELRPKIRTRLGDVEIDNPNLMYHQKEATLRGMFTTTGNGSRLVENGVAPGIPKVGGQPGYVWFNRGKPYVNHNSKYLVTTSASNPNLLHVRSQNYPIGQWNGKSGFVTNAEYVSPNTIQGSVYQFEPGYGYRKVVSDNRNIMDFDQKYIEFHDIPFYYDARGNFIPNPNYYYRRGWGIIDDAQQTGVIRVPPGDYKTEALRKYPWLDNGNPFNTALMNHKFPYFSEGHLWNSQAKFGVEPEDLIAIHKNAGNAQWVAGSKFGTLKPNAKPNEYGGRATPLVNGETNKFPTSEAKLFRLNKDTNRYIPLNNIFPFGIGALGWSLYNRR